MFGLMFVASIHDSNFTTSHLQKLPRCSLRCTFRPFGFWEFGEGVYVNDQVDSSVKYEYAYTYYEYIYICICVYTIHVHT